MIRPEVLTGDRLDGVFAEAIRQRMPLLLTHKVGGRWHSRKSVLLDAATAARVFVASDSADDSDHRGPFVPGEQLAAAFRYRNHKCLFVTTFLASRRLSGHTLPGGTAESFILTWPEKIEQLQRRAYYRVEIPRETPVAVQLHRGGWGSPSDPTPSASKQFTARLLDMSVGGMRVELPRGQDPAFGEDEVVGVELRPDPNSPGIEIEACFRHAEPTDSDRLALGFQFVGLELTANGPTALARLARTVSHLQRSTQPRRRQLT